MATIRDVAKLAGVSISTVSAVINNSKNVSPELKYRVQNAIEAINYKVERRTDTNGKKTIGVILPTMTSVFFSNVLKGITDVFSKDSYTVIFYDSNMSFEKEVNYVNILRRHGISGLILDSVCPTEESDRYFGRIRKEYIEKREIPVVILERVVNMKGFRSVSADHRRACYMSTEYLIKKGHRKIAHISSIHKIPFLEDRTRGYREALADAGIAYQEELVAYGDITAMSGYVAMHSLLEVNSGLTALVSINDHMAIGAMKAIKQAGWSIPGDIAVVGFDNISISSMIEPALTTVNYPAYRMGYLAALKITTPQETSSDMYDVNMLDTKLIVRKSSEKEAINEWELFGW